MGKHKSIFNGLCRIMQTVISVKASYKHLWRSVSNSQIYIIKLPARALWSIPGRLEIMSPFGHLFVTLQGVQLTEESLNSSPFNQMIIIIPDLLTLQNFIVWVCTQNTMKCIWLELFSQVANLELSTLFSTPALQLPVLWMANLSL